MAEKISQKKGISVRVARKQKPSERARGKKERERSIPLYIALRLMLAVARGVIPKELVIELIEKEAEERGS